MRIKQQGNIIKNLRRMIPEFSCQTGCIDCCGPVPWVFWEKKQIQSIMPIEKLNPNKSIISNCGISCPYSEKEKGCLIYPERPILCRVFGASDVVKIKCTKGFKSLNPLSVKKTSQIMDRYLTMKPQLILKNLFEQLNPGKNYTSEAYLLGTK